MEIFNDGGQRHAHHGLVQCRKQDTKRQGEDNEDGLVAGELAIEVWWDV